MPGQQLFDWFDNPIPAKEPAPKPDRNTNPCLTVYGPGPDNQKCEGCIHLRFPQHHSAKRYWKCDLRKLSHGSATDHKVSWPACGKYERREGEYNGG